MTVAALPTQLTLYINFPCNLRCKNCYLFGIADYDTPYMAEGTVQEMSWEVFERAVDPLLAGPAPFSVCIMGGEPLLHKGLARFVEYLKQRGDSYVDINTNGTIHPRRLEAIVDAGIDAVYVSLDGGTAATNDAGRGSGSFRLAMRGLEHLLVLRERGYRDLHVAINYTITNLNYRDLVMTAELCDRLGVAELFLNMPTFVRQDEGERAKARVRDELGMSFDSWKGFVIDDLVDGVDQEALRAQLVELAERSWPFDLYVQPVRYSIDELPLWFSSRWGEILREHSCPIQEFRTTVLPNGDVIPCTVYPDVVVGNVLEDSLPEIWHGQRYGSFRALVDERLLPTCTRCCDLYDEGTGDPGAFVSGSRRQYVLKAGAR